MAAGGFNSSEMETRYESSTARSHMSLLQRSAHVANLCLSTIPPSSPHSHPYQLPAITVPVTGGWPSRWGCTTESVKTVWDLLVSSDPDV